MQYLEVTQADIDESRNRRTASTLDRQRNTYNSERDCPLGIALSREFATDYVRAHPDFLRVGRLFGDNAKSFESTQIIQSFMKLWDRHMQADPHRFKLIKY